MVQALYLLLELSHFISSVKHQAHDNWHHHNNGDNYRMCCQLNKNATLLMLLMDFAFPYAVVSLMILWRPTYVIKSQLGSSTSINKTYSIPFGCILALLSKEKTFFLIVALNTTKLEWAHFKAFKAKQNPTYSTWYDLLITNSLKPPFNT